MEFKLPGSKFLKIQIIIFISFIVVLALTLAGLLIGKFFFGAKYIMPITVITASILVLSFFTYGLYTKSKWAYHAGFALISLALIVCLWWQYYFRHTLLIQIRFLEYWLLNMLAIINVLVVSSFIIIIILGLYIQLKLKKEFVK